MKIVEDALALGDVSVTTSLTTADDKRSSQNCFSSSLSGLS